MATYVTYALAVWEGERPAGDQDARAVFDALYAQYVGRPRGEPAVPPTPRIEAYMRALLARYPQNLTGDSPVDPEASPWTTRLTHEVTGPLMYFPITISHYVKVSYSAAQLAAEHGLICYDLQWNKLRP
ncbi:hypothetical protein ACIA5D_08360 [Actinoplanes sp. NPDC051513]|uniref:hypothetical protein n=1 Tax=Actinoplanes sp. NPDC051513 TaxID=3363908 RepID=UPI0037A293E6